MKKELAIALPLALGAPLCAHATCSTYASGTAATTTTCTAGAGNDLTLLRSQVTLQASAGVAIKAQDGSSGTTWGANDIAVSSCHDAGASAFYGDTGGGSIQKNADFGTGNCTAVGSISYTLASSG
ncbi:MAG: hypothetical protein GWN54_13755 [Gammaproteobacteria bacterium]|nr:hypothetical protein [Gammaproteobacteria bacterium]NIX10265.1 hypothetical protein [Gammaproteobacteria bacterium]